MITEVLLPEISENVEYGDVINVLVKVDDFVEKEESLVELETEKASFDVPSPVDGKVVEIDVKEGDKAQVGQLILKIDTEARPGEKREVEQKSAEIRGAEKEPTEMEDMFETKERAKPVEGEEEKVRGQAAREKVTLQVEKEKAGPIVASPAVRQLARELGVDIQQVKDISESGMITVEDVKEYVRGILTCRGGTATEIKAIRRLPDFTKWGDIEREPITSTRRKIADTLSYTWSTVPQVSQYDQADITSLEESRKLYSAEKGHKLTITAIVLKIAGMAMKEFPKFNASFDDENNEIIYKKYIHVSVAVETDKGLLVPVIKDVDKKSILQLSDELNDLAERTREHKVTPDDMVGGNFTISNLGGIGGTGFAPIIYWPQTAILGISRAAKQASYKSGWLNSRLILPVSLSYDHRVIDGVEGLNFLRRIVKYLENPFLLSLDKTGA